MKFLFFSLVFFLTKTFSQISPGELAKSHSEFEGINNCTKCHTLGKEISGDKCLECHKEIKKRIDEKHGFHFTQKNKQCVECHKDHFGKSFSMIKFDTKKFNHDEATYKLEGEHKKNECEKCHNSEKIKDEDILKNKKKNLSKTFLGLSKNCLSCHNDEHKDQLADDCFQCHNNEFWKDVKKFNHDNSKFKLIGKHKSVKCELCHQYEMKDKEIHLIKFKPLKFSDCSNCHKDVHDKKFGNTCKDCHSENSWKEITKEKFNHSFTKYPLLGKHKFVKCENCHKGNTKQQKLKFEFCSDCHKDYHNGIFANRNDKGKCESCHSVEKFSPSTFTIENHKETEFELKGSHANVNCNKCHTKEGSEIKFKWTSLECKSCHKDIHNGIFANRNDKGKCESCHSVEKFIPSIFTIENHKETKFELKGSHANVNCNKCHTKEGSEIKFKWTSLECKSCHKDIHKNQFKQQCENCHKSSSWKSLTFSHGETKFPLTGSHLAISCYECHKIVETKTQFERRQFSNTKKNCFDCHLDNHNRQFEDENKLTHCERCHTTENWKLLIFDHNKHSKYILDGKHINVSCEKCHKNETQSGKNFVRYKPIAASCKDCHGS